MERSELALWIGGKPRAASKTFEVVNPADGEVFARAPWCDEAALGDAVAMAHEAFRNWREDPQRRAEAMLACAARIKEHAADLGRLITMETGKPLRKGIEEAFLAAMVLEGNAHMPLEPEVFATEPSRVVAHRRPLGVVAAIAPWNFPLGLSMWKIGPALRAGNCVVLKPSPFSPTSSLRLAELLADAVPPGVLSVLTGPDDVGRSLVADPRVRKVGFTGSVETGLSIARACACDLKRVTLEMGGNDAAIVLPDADVGAIAESLFWGAFDNAGQVCSVIKRLYAHDDIVNDLVEALAERARKTKVGDPMDDSTELGPIANRRQLDRVESLVSAARSNGAKIPVGGQRLDRPGCFYPPTLVTEVDDREAIVATEQFGPVLPILRFSDIDDVVQRANATPYGLGGSVWTSDPDRGAQIAGALEVGTAWVNQHFVIDSPAPFGGWKHSGIGRENGLEGLHAYTELQVVSIAGSSA